MQTLPTPIVSDPGVTSLGETAIAYHWNVGLGDLDVTFDDNGLAWPLLEGRGTADIVERSSGLASHGSFRTGPPGTSPFQIFVMLTTTIALPTFPGGIQEIEFYPIWYSQGGSPWPRVP